ncbi:MAG: bifunctional DNA primase/polymerase, partial [Solirubrobacteraceae bacterium]
MAAHHRHRRRRRRGRGRRRRQGHDPGRAQRGGLPPDGLTWNCGSKRPVVEDWPHWLATRETVEAWWRARPEANVDIRTGDGLVVVDVDPRHGGHLALDQLQAQHGRIPSTLQVLTGGGGAHLYFRAPKDLRSFELASG